MANAIRDENRIPVALGVSTTDSTVPLPFKVDSTTGRVLVSSAYTATSAVWATTGNTDVVTDANVAADSFIVVMHTDIPVGNWKVVPGAGSFTVTSSDSESAGLTYKYKILV